jgi:uncharacterized protein (TIGR00266 family)
MKHRICFAPTFTTLEFELDEGEVIAAQPGCMLAMTTGLELTAGAGTHMKGQGRIGRAARSMLAGESYFSANYRAKRNGERLVLAPAEMGEIRGLEVRAGAHHYISPGSFLACTQNVQLSIEYAGVKGFMATRGFFLMRTTGEGQVFISSYGALVEQTLADEERFVLDNRYIVCFADTMKYELVKVTSSIRHAYLTGEGLVNRFTGPGSLLYQTRARPGRGFLRGLFEIAT